LGWTRSLAGSPLQREPVELAGHFEEQGCLGASEITERFSPTFFGFFFKRQADHTQLPGESPAHEPRACGRGLLVRGAAQVDWKSATVNLNLPNNLEQWAKEYA